MGLDISVYSQLTRVQPVNNDEDCDEYIIPVTEEGVFDDVISLYPNPHFLRQAGDIKESDHFTYEEEMGFRAGSYSGYNHWRSQLASLVNHPQNADYPDIDFNDLIYFSDCEGVITGESAKKLYQHFLKWDKAAQDLNDEYFYELYKTWTEAFQLAADNGAVDFH